MGIIAQHVGISEGSRSDRCLSYRLDRSGPRWEGHVQRPYSEEQVRRLLVAVESTIPNNIKVEERKVRDPHAD
jgi:hypothetical protein